MDDRNGMDIVDENEKRKGAEELKEKLDEAVEKAGGREALAQRFGEVTVKLKKPLDFNGTTVEEIHMDFLGLTGLDMELIDDQIGALGLRGLLPAYSRKYQRMLAARAADVPEALLLRLPLADYNAVVGAAQNFLLVTG